MTQMTNQDAKTLGLRAAEQCRKYRHTDALVAAHNQYENARRFHADMCRRTRLAEAIGAGGTMMRHLRADRRIVWQAVVRSRDHLKQLERNLQ